MPVYVSRLSQWIEKRFNAKGGNVLVDIDTVARVVLPWHVGVEDRYLQGWNKYGFATNIVGVAAQVNAMRIRNPTGSNVIMVIEKWQWGPTTADQPLFQHSATGGDLTTVASLALTRLDPRGNPAPTAVISTDNNAGAKQLNTFMTGQVNAVVTWDFIGNPNQEVPILPGDAYQISNNNANVTTFMGIMWRERALELSELT